MGVIFLKKNKKRGGIATIIITIVFVVITLVSIPMFKSLSNSNSDAASKSDSMFTNFVNDTQTFVESNMGGSTNSPFASE